MRETGLEAGDAIGHEQSCFKASSGDHPEFRTTRNRWTLYHPPPHKQRLLFFCLQNIFNASGAEKNADET
jgi:hypothetical protein